MKIKVPVKAILGISTEVAYALTIILAAFLLCLAFYWKPWS